jgi:site-specific recombinase XerD
VICGPKKRKGVKTLPLSDRCRGWLETHITPAGVYEGCKHSSATYLKELGVDDRLLATIMGHSDPSSAEKYAKIQGTAIKSALAKLEPK